MTATRTTSQIGGPHGLRRSLVSLLLLLAGCNLIGDEAPPSGDLLQAYYAPGCAPTDGPALDMYLLPEEASCDALNRIRFVDPPEQTFTFLSLYGIAEPAHLSTYRLDSEVATGFSYSEGGQGIRCRVADACVSVRRGTVTFKQPARTETVIDVALVYEDGSRHVGRYDAQSCPRRILCG